MDLKSILSISEKDLPELYWSLIIEPGWVQAGIWRIVDDKAQVVFASSPVAWKLEEELIQASDVVLSACAQNLPDNVKDPSKTVFGVVSSWVSAGEIKEEYLDKIKRICSDLSLEPAGFVVLSEAIAHLVKIEEGSPLSAVVLGVYEEHIDISLFKLGNLAGNTSVSKSVSVVDDLVEGLTRLSNKDTFPSRFILYDGKESELEEIRQALLKANWDDVEKVKFLHTPKIEILTPERKVNAVSLAGASEIADVSSIQVVEEEKKDEDEKETGEENLENISPDEGVVTASDLGFVLGEDIVAQKKQELHVRKTEEGKREVDVAEKVPGESLKKDIPGDVFTEKTEKKSLQFKIKKPNTARIIFGLKNFFASIIPRKAAKSVSPSPDKTGKKMFVIGGVVFTLLIFGVFALWWFYPKAEVAVYVTTKRLDEKIEILVDPKTDVPNLSEKKLPGKLLNIEVSGSKTKSTTGTKTVGEKAKGQITFYRAGNEITLSQGTELTGPNSLKFILDDDVTVASGSASSPGIADASITAVDIGAQYNLASGSSFSVANYSTGDIEAKNESSFSGGTSREISAVSEEDLEDLEQDLTEELLEQAKKDFENELNKEFLLVEESISSKVLTKDFSDKVGDEADTVKLTLSLDTTAISINRSALNEIAMALLDEKVPEGFVLKEEQIDMDFEFKEDVDGVYAINVSIAANLLPEVKPDNIAKKIAGKYPTLAKKYLNEEVPGFVRAEIIFKPKLPGRLGTLPRLVKNIEVEIVAER